MLDSGSKTTPGAATVFLMEMFEQIGKCGKSDMLKLCSACYHYVAAGPGQQSVFIRNYKLDCPGGISSCQSVWVCFTKLYGSMLKSRTIQQLVLF